MQLRNIEQQKFKKQNKLKNNNNLNNHKFNNNENIIIETSFLKNINGKP